MAAGRAAGRSGRWPGPAARELADRPDHYGAVGAGERAFALLIEHAVRVSQDLLRSALGVQGEAVVAVVGGRHQPDARVETEQGAALLVTPGGGERHTGPGGQVEQRELGRITVAGGGVGSGAPGGGPGDRSDVGGRLRAVGGGLSGERPDGRHPHPVLGQRAGLVRADHGGRAQGLHCGEPLHHGAGPGQGAYPGGEGERDGGQQPLRDVGDQQTDGEAHGGCQGETGGEAERQESQADPDRDHGDQPGGAFDLLLQWARFRVGAFAERRDPAQFGVHAGRGHHGDRLAARAGGAGEEQFPGVHQRSCHVHVLRGPDGGDRLAGECGQVDLDRAGQEPGVGRDPVALLDRQHVTRDQVGGRHLPAGAVADHGGGLGQEGGQSLDRPLGLLFLGEGQHGVEHDHRDDRHRQRGCPADHREHGGERQQQSQRVGELLGELAGPASPAAPGQGVGPVDRLPPGRFAFAQSLGRAAQRP